MEKRTIARLDARPEVGEDRVKKLYARHNHSKTTAGCAIDRRYLVQPDYRWLPASNSSSAFGYDFEGALQVYVLLDERIITAPDGESTLVSVPEDLSASALALVEPWACVENSYVEKQRRTLISGGRLLVIGETLVDKNRIWRLPGKPKKTSCPATFWFTLRAAV